MIDAAQRLDEARAALDDDLFLHACRVARAFEPSQIVLWEEWWPIGYCNLTCMMLNPLLRSIKGFTSSIVFGFVNAVEGVNRGGAHAWIETPEGHIIDPTFGQFRDKDDRLPALLTLRSDERGDLFDPQFCVTPTGEAHYRVIIETRSRTATGGTGMRHLFSHLRLVATD